MTDARSVSPDVLADVRARYADGARRQVPELCCPVDYDASLLEALPAEIVERDYGCGDPSRFVRPGDVVLDLGSGSGKIAYMASQLAGPEGRVIGVDATPDMLALARKYRAEVGRRIGWQNVEFRHGRIQDLGLDLDRVEAWLADHPVRSAADLDRLRAEEQRLRLEEPRWWPTNRDRPRALELRPEPGRATARRRRASSRRSTACSGPGRTLRDLRHRLRRGTSRKTLQKRPGTLVGLHLGRDARGPLPAGLRGRRPLRRRGRPRTSEEPWAVVRRHRVPLDDRRSPTRARKAPVWEHNEAVDLSSGPWKPGSRRRRARASRRGERTAVCRKTFEILTRAPYAEQRRSRSSRWSPWKSPRRTRHRSTCRRHARAHARRDETRAWCARTCAPGA